MYSNRIRNYPALWLGLLVCLPGLFVSQIGGVEKGSTKDDNYELREFPQLLHMIDETQRVHIVSEMVQNGRRIQVDEYIDLKEFSQLVQFKWHEIEPQVNGGEPPTSRLDSTNSKLRTRKLNTLVLNGDKKSVLYQYEQFKCISADVTQLNDPADLKSLSWTSIVDNKPSNGTRGRPFNLNSALSALTKLETSNGNESAKWIAGVAGLWLKAQSTSKQKPPYHPKYMLKGVLYFDQGVWRLETSGQLKIDYYPSRLPIRGTKSQSGEAPLMIVLRDDSGDEILTVNVFHIEFNFSNQLAGNLFMLPIGFDCPTWLDHNLARGVYFPDQRSQLMELELVATRFAGRDPSRRTDVRNVQLARARHPIDRFGSLNMFRSIEDRLKVIQDNSNKLEYKIYYNSGAGRTCEIQHLQFVGAMPRGNNTGSHTRLASINPIKLDFANGVQLDLSEFNMDFLLGLHESDTSRMRLLNVLEVSDEKAELVFESAVLEQDLRQLITFNHDKAAKGQTVKTVPRNDGNKFKLRLVRIYDKELVRSSDNKTKSRGGLVEFSRAIVFVHSAETDERVAEIRLNLMESTHLMSSRRRARLFDLSQCHDLAEESMQLVGYYPADPKLLASISDQGSEIIESFYRSAYDWAGASLDAVGKPREVGPVERHKYGLGASLNFMRVPRLELKVGATDELEIHLTVLERPSPLDLFELIPNSNFLVQDHDDGEDQFLINSLRDCAKRCILYNCKVFAHQAASKQCKLSRLPLLQTDSSSLDDKSKQSEGVKLVMSPVSDVYYEPLFISNRHISEASLADLSSYIEHIAEQLDSFMLVEDELDDQAMRQHRLTEAISSGPFTTRHRRSVGPLEQPLFVFNFEDRSGQLNDYDPPRKRSIVPSELIIERQPPLFDVAALTQANRVSNSFRTKFVGKAYKLTALDEQQSGSGANAALAGGGNPLELSKKSERVFRDKHNEIYYTLKQVASITLDMCALLCYNTNEVDFSRENSEQVCDSFSFSKADDLCVLLVRTDYKFVRSVLDLVEEGDLVLELADPNELLVKSFDGNLMTRRHLANFEGPLELAERQTGRKSLAGIQIVGLEFEWLSAIEVESTLLEDDQGEQCARECAKRNKRGPDLCLAFDHCFTHETIQWRDAAKAKQRLECKMLLIREGPERTRPQIKQIKWLRSRLAQAAARDDQANGTANSGASEQPNLKPAKGTTTCKRYLMSHLREFNHLNKCQLNPNSQTVGRKLERLSELVEGANQDACAMECSLESGACLLFEFCQEVRPAGHQVEQRCSLYRRTEARDEPDRRPTKTTVAAAAAAAAAADVFGRPAEALTSYQDGCHVFVRREFKNIEEALSDRALDEMMARRSAGRATQFQHKNLVVVFVLAFAATSAALAALFVVWWRTPAGTQSDWRRPLVTIPMQDLTD